MKRMLSLLQTFCLMVVLFGSTAIQSVYAQSPTDFGRGAKLVYSTEDSDAFPLFDGSTGINYYYGNKYVPGSEEEGERLMDCAVIFKVDHPVTVNGYSFFPENYDGYLPTSWVLMGSTDGGESWDLLDEREDCEDLATDYYKYHHFFLAESTEKKYDTFLFAVSKTNDPYYWRLYEITLDYARCDAFGHKDKLIAHKASQPTCTTLGYTQDCYECPNCGGFYLDKNGYRKIGQNPIIQTTVHHFVGGECQMCHSTDARVATIASRGVQVTIPGEDDAKWGVLAQGDKHGEGLRSTSEVGQDGQLALQLQSETPFRLSFKATLGQIVPQHLDDLWDFCPNSELYVDGEWMFYNIKREVDQEIESEDFEASYVNDPSKVEVFTKDFPAGQHSIDFNISSGSEDGNTQLNIWDIKLEVVCNHVRQERELVKTIEANCSSPTRNIYRCLTCNEEYEEMTGNIVAGVHKHVIRGKKGQAATCTAYGFTADCWYCEDCGICFEDQALTHVCDGLVTIAPLGHDYESNICTRCHAAEDHRITHMDIHGVTATISMPDGADAEFSCKPEGMEGDYTLTDRYGLTRTFPANALVSEGGYRDQSRNIITLESDKPFFLTFKLDYSVKSTLHYGKATKVVIDNNETIETDDAYEEGEHAYMPEFFAKEMPAGKHKLALLYGFEFYEGIDSNNGDGDDRGYIYDFAACSHEGMLVYNKYFEGDCVNPSLTQVKCSHCEWCDTIPGELDPLRHPHDLMAVSKAESCMTKGIKRAYYFCEDCNQRFWDAQGTQPTDDDPLEDMMAHEWGADGKCKHCGQSHYYDGTPVMPKQITLANCDTYGLTSDYVGFYAITTPAELYGFAAHVQKAVDKVIEMKQENDELDSDFIMEAVKDYRCANAVLLDDITVNPSVLDGKNLRSDVSSLAVWKKIGHFWHTEAAYGGTLDGQGHTISGLYRPFLNEGEDDENLMVGLFSRTYGNTIRNLNIADSYFRGRTWVGAIAGYNSGTIENCHVQALIELDADKEVESYHAENAGIIAGENGYTSSIINCYAEGVVRGGWVIGGIAGENHGNIMNCLANVEFGDTHKDGIGGITYYNSDDGNIRNCYYVQRNDIESVRNDYGGYGYNNCETQADPVTEQMIAFGEVAYKLQQGARFETGYWEKEEHYFPGDAWGQAIGTDPHPTVREGAPRVYLGYISCENPNPIYTNQIVSLDGGGHMFDHQGICRKTPGTIHYQPCEQDEEGTYLISNYGQLYNFMALVNAEPNGDCDYNARLTADIIVNDSLAADGSDKLYWKPIGQFPSRDMGYWGDFDGQGHSITGLCATHENVSHVGLFGSLERDAHVHDLMVKNSEFRGYDMIGALAGYQASGATIEHCATIDCQVSTTTPDESSKVGGIVGSLHGNLLSSYTNYHNLYGDKKDSECTISNAYYQVAGNTSTDKYGFVADELASGALCYRLNGNIANELVMWRQTLGSDDMPVLSDTARVVYYGIDDCTQMTRLTYSNFEVWPDRAEHLYDNGLCERCNTYEPAPLMRQWYEVSNMGQLYWTVEKAAEENKENRAILIRLTNDITVNTNVLKDDGSLQKGNFRKWTPFGSYKVPFFGTIDGQDHTISGLYCAKDSLCGLVASIKGVNPNREDCTIEDYYGIRNLTIEDSYFETTKTPTTKAPYGYAAAFAGIADNYVAFSLLTSHATVQSTAYAGGGIVAHQKNDCIVDNCSNYGKLNVYGYVGGIVGWQDGTSRILNCDNQGDVAANAKSGQGAGGVVGYIQNAQGSVTESAKHAILGCVNYGDVTGYQAIGGVAGRMYNRTGIQFSYNLGGVRATKNAGGVVGLSSAKVVSDRCGIYYCYNGGEVTQGTSKVNNVAGNISGTEVVGCYTWNDNGRNFASVANVPSKAKRRAAATTDNTSTQNVCLQQMGSGELCYILNLACGNNIYRQRVGIDLFPTLSGPVVHRHKTEGTYKSFEEGDMNGDDLVDEDDVTFMGKVLIGEEEDPYDATLEMGESEISISSIANKISKLQK